VRQDLRLLVPPHIDFAFLASPTAATRSHHLLFPFFSLFFLSDALTPPLASSAAALPLSPTFSHPLLIKAEGRDEYPTREELETSRTARIEGRRDVLRLAQLQVLQQMVPTRHASPLPCRFCFHACLASGSSGGKSELPELLPSMIYPAFGLIRPNFSWPVQQRHLFAAPLVLRLFGFRIAPLRI
jgi:hypothetical protein